MAYKRIPTLCIEDAEILWRNFSGKEKTYNEEGDRNFCVFIDDDEMAQKLAADGWNVKIKKPYDETEEPRYYIKVRVSFESNTPPLIVLKKGKNTIELDESTIGRLDTADIIYIDLEINPYDYGSKRGGKPAISAYVKEMYVTIAESRFAAKYAAKEAPEEEPW